jgi:hypothetical protein
MVRSIAVAEIVQTSVCRPAVIRCPALTLTSRRANGGRQSPSGRRDLETRRGSLGRGFGSGLVTDEQILDIDGRRISVTSPGKVVSRSEGR